MEIPAQLNGLQTFFEKEGFEVEYHTMEEAGVEMLQVPIDEELALQIRFLHEGSDLNFPILQIISAFPFTAKPELAGSVARYLLMINKTVDMPGYDYHEPDGIIFFRSIHLCESETIHEDVLKTLLGGVLNMQETFEEPIRAIATGEKTIEEVLKEALES